MHFAERGVIPSVFVTSQRSAQRFDSKPPLQIPIHGLVRLQVLFPPVRTGSTGLETGVIQSAACPDVSPILGPII